MEKAKAAAAHAVRAVKTVVKDTVTVVKKTARVVVPTAKTVVKQVVKPQRRSPRRRSRPSKRQIISPLVVYQACDVPPALTANPQPRSRPLGHAFARWHFPDRATSFTVTLMWHKVAAGLYWIEDADGLPLALASAMDDGTPLKVAEQWWAASSALLDWAVGDAGREWLSQFGELDEPGDD
jgi:hypothetical protein